ncbi:DUF1003 domain-containing protein [Bradyrhizobium sp. Ash2021]|uniref:DUF1003 domain-containing protein n=1 Tax=Bradyrhizobium sp. Ash2021 TaxID=2954771 RepID=UPI0028167870|nr:DUF1003 domain-containing protein [Bradyrhizobium sp. Ash2021]WMT76895.1 DUF1003 domain-containing protein [Bradyrhizobium sp. Ash2021]
MWRRLNAIDWKYDRLRDASAVRMRSRTIKSVEPELDSIEPTDRELLGELRRLRRSLRLRPTDTCDPMESLSVGQRVADKVAGVMGSWKFIIVQTVLLVAWVSINFVAAARSWDPFPFILLNLALSVQAGYAAPILMMSQNRQQDIDRRAADNDYRVNVKAELEIELLHEKIDELRTREVLGLTEAVKCLTDLLLQTRQSGRADFVGPVE